MTSPQQKKFFDTFGFLVLSQTFSPQEARAIEDAYERIMTDAFGEPARRLDLTKQFVIDPGFCERSAFLRNLPEDPRILQTVQDLLGPGAFYTGSDGALRVGDTDWHPDQGWDPSIPEGREDPNFQAQSGHYYPGIKVAIYIDVVGADTGCLRVIPCSIQSPFHEMLRSLHCDIPDRGASLLEDPNFKQLGLAPAQVPAYAIESGPGDVVFFSHQLWHAAIGGAKGRRMFAMSFKAEPSNEGQQNLANHKKNRSKGSREQTPVVA